MRLAQGGDRDAVQAIDAVRNRWLVELERHISDPAVALAVTLIGDGLYYHSALRAELASVASADVAAIEPASMDALVALLERVARETPPAERG